MADKAIHELTITTTPTDGMYFEVSYPDGFGGWLSLRISWATLKNESLNNDNVKRGTSTLATGINKIPFGSDFANSNYALAYNVYDSSGVLTNANFVSQDTDGFTLNNEWGSSLTVTYIAIL